MQILYRPGVTDDSGFINRCIQLGHEVAVTDTLAGFADFRNAELIVDCNFKGEFPRFNGYFLFHCPAQTFSQWSGAPEKSARFCGWPGFWQGEVIEIALKAPVMLPEWLSILKDIGLQVVLVPDIAGLIAPRILCTIINEAAFTAEAHIASETDIDTAMKLGTNYPRGPLAWAKEIGIEEVVHVLKEMSKEDAKYSPCNFLQSI